MKRVLLILIVVLAAACGGETKDETSALSRATPTPTGAVPASATPSSATPSSDAAGARATTAPSARPKTAATPAPAGTSAPAGGTKAAPTATNRPASSGPIRPATGKYRFHEEGTRRAGTAGQKQPYESDGNLTVSASGSRTTLHFETQQGSDEMTLRYEKDRVLLERARIEQAIATFDARFDPAQVVLRFPIKVGDSWTNTWKAGGTSGTTEIKVDRQESVRAFGKSWRAFVIVNATKTSGDAKGTTSSSSWYVAELGLDVKRISDFAGTYQAVPFEQHSERVLTARP